MDAAALTTNPVPSQASFLDWLVEAQSLTPILAERVARVQSETSDRLAAILLKLGLLSEARLADQMARYRQLPRLDSTKVPAEPVALAEINTSFLRTREVVPLYATDTLVEVACWDALDDFVPTALEFALGRPVSRVVGTRTEIGVALERLYQGTAEGAGGGRSPNELVENEEVDRLKDLASDAPIIRLVQRLIDQAVASKASDIHLEASERALHVRFRLDGLLRQMLR